jgi:hypothetical protein
MDKDEVRGQNVEARSHNEELERPEEPVLVLKASELAVRVEEFLAAKQVVAPADAGQIARAMAESLARGSSPAQPQEACRPPKPNVTEGELSAAATAGTPTGREKPRRSQAKAALRAVFLADVLYSL